MNARTRTERATLRQRIRTQRAASRIARRGSASLATHVIAAGLPVTQARTVASSLRRNAQKLGLVGTTVRVHVGRRMRTAHRFTPAQVAAAASAYRPRRAEYRLVAEALRLTA